MVLTRVWSMSNKLGLQRIYPGSDKFDQYALLFYTRAKNKNLTGQYRIGLIRSHVGSTFSWVFIAKLMMVH